VGWESSFVNAFGRAVVGIFLVGAGLLDCIEEIKHDERWDGTCNSTVYLIHNSPSYSQSPVLPMQSQSSILVKLSGVLRRNT
jgi:hypothetical protein